MWDEAGDEASLSQDAVKCQAHLFAGCITERVHDVVLPTASAWHTLAALHHPVCCYAQYWTQIMTDIHADPWTRSYTMFDILNEPDSYGLTWPFVGPLYHQVMTVGHKINPSALRCRSRARCRCLHQPDSACLDRGSFSQRCREWQWPCTALCHCRSAMPGLLGSAPGT